METKINGVVLRATDYGEYDRILTILSAEEGKITAGIKGVRKNGAKLRFAAQPFALCEYVINRGPSRSTVTGAYETESFYEIRLDISRFYAASAACEAADGLTIEGYECPELFSALVRALADICGGDEKDALIRFLLVALSGAGYGINAGACPFCGEPLEDREALKFDYGTGSFACTACCGGPGASPATYRYIRSLQAGEDTAADTDTGRRTMKLLRSYINFRTGTKCAALSELINLT